MRTNQAGQSMIKGYETLELEAYPDPGSDLGKACAAKRLPMRDYRKIAGWQKLKGGPWTIGWGHTGGVKQGDVITAERASELFVQDVERMEAGINRYVTVPLTDNQFSALVVFCFNVGIGDPAQKIDGFSTSTMLKKLNAGDYAGAAEQFPRWNKSGGKVMGGLITRRAAEQKLFLTP
jgi:lysozyme